MIDKSDDERDAWRAWFEAAKREDVSRELVDWQGRLDAELAVLPGRCEMSGRCCKFDSHGHRLYVTAIEIAWVLNGLDADRLALLRDADLVGVDGCVFQVNGMCTARELRPLGCRVYLCDPAAKAWQDEVYERYLKELREMHDRWGVAYRYLEWRAGLAAAI